MTTDNSSPNALWLYDFSDKPVFGPSESRAQEANLHLRSHAALTKAQLAGLLNALAEYSGRFGRTLYDVMGIKDPEMVAANQALDDFFWHRRSRIGNTGQLVFDAQESSRCEKHKDLLACADLKVPQLLALLETLDRFSRKVPKLKFRPGFVRVRSPSSKIPLLRGLARQVHAHNALVSFPSQPFTCIDFVLSVHAILRGENSLVSPPTGHELEIPIC